MQTRDTNYINRNELDKACFQHMAYGKYKDLEKRRQSDKVLKGKAFEIANNPKYDGYQRGLASIVYRFFDNKSKGTSIKSMRNQQLANELHTPIIRKFKIQHFMQKRLIQLNLLQLEKKICLSLHYNGDSSYLFVNGTEIIKFKAKDSEIVANPLCLGNISEDVSSANMKKTGFYGSVFDLSVDCRVTAVDDILDIYKYIMKKNGI